MKSKDLKSEINKRLTCYGMRILQTAYYAFRNEIIFAGMIFLALVQA